MPVEFLSDDQVAAYSRFAGPPRRAQLQRYFFLDDVDRKLIDRRRDITASAATATSSTALRRCGGSLWAGYARPAVGVGAMRHEPVYRGILGIDIERYSRAEWTDPIRARLRERLHRLVDHALAQAGIHHDLTRRSDVGDGLWLLVAAEVSTARLLHPFVTGLVAGLIEDNRQAPAAERMRLRLVVHAGQVLPDAHGETGASFILAARLLDAEATRLVLSHSVEAAAVAVVSDVVYEGVVRHGYRGIDPAVWQAIEIHVKETAARAWVHLPGLAEQPVLPELLLLMDAARPESARTPTTPAVGRVRRRWGRSWAAVLIVTVLLLASGVGLMLTRSWSSEIGPLTGSPQSSARTGLTAVPSTPPVTARPSGTVTVRVRPDQYIAVTAVIGGMVPRQGYPLGLFSAPCGQPAALLTGFADVESNANGSSAQTIPSGKQLPRGVPAGSSLRLGVPVAPHTGKPEQAAVGLACANIAVAVTQPDSPVIFSIG